uniref:Uncharacterized protein n=1 Tax=Panagrolaimus sp. PS1159 TaxID=55785 RepID=A0AC35FD85_9BILA
MTTGNGIRFDDKDEKCATVLMESPEATAKGFQPFPSCDPKKYDGKVIKLSVSGVTYGCPLYVLNAKKWIPPPTTTTQNSSALSEIDQTTSKSSEANTTLWIGIGLNAKKWTPPPPTTTTQNSSDLSETNQTTSKSSEANTTLWIGIGVGIFILLIVVIGFSYCCYQTQIQKKPLFGTKKDVQQKVFLPEASKKANVVKEKPGDEEQVLKAEPTKEEIVAKPQSSKEATAAKEKRAKPTKKKIPKEKKAPVEPKPSKEITQEDNPPPKKKVSAEPTIEASTTETSVVQKSVFPQQKQHHNGNPPRVFVP